MDKITTIQGWQERFSKKSCFCLIIMLLITFFLLLTDAFSSPVQAQSEPGEEWEWRNPFPTGNSLFDVTWSGDQFVAVGSSGISIFIKLS